MTIFVANGSDVRSHAHSSRQSRVQINVIQTDDGVFYDDAGEHIPVPCQWFALCDNNAVATEHHPILGDVPICRRCRDNVHRR